MKATLKLQEMGLKVTEEFVAQLGRVVDPVPREEKAKDGAKKGDEKDRGPRSLTRERVARICLLYMKYMFIVQLLLPCVV